MELLIEKPGERLLSGLDCARWPLWNCPVSRFPWHYAEEETCYFLAGHVIVRTKTASFELERGMLVTFAAGLDCEWEVLAPVRKHYTFGLGRMNISARECETC